MEPTSKEDDFFGTDYLVYENCSSVQKSKTSAVTMTLYKPDSLVGITKARGLEGPTPKMVYGMNGLVGIRNPSTLEGPYRVSKQNANGTYQLTHGLVVKDNIKERDLQPWQAPVLESHG